MKLPHIPSSALRATLAALATIVVLIIIAWIIDDVVGGEEIPRGVEVDTVAIGSMSRAQAAIELAAHLSLETPITLVWQQASVTATAAELGISVDIDATLEEAAKRGGITEPLRWLLSPISNRHLAPHYVLDRNVLVGLLGEGSDAVLLVEPDGAAVALVDGVFVSADNAEIPVVDLDALELLLLETIAARSDTPIEVPTLGNEEINVGGTELARRANELTEAGIEVALVGFSEYHPIPERVLRQWLRFSAEGEISVDNESVVSTLSALFVGLGDPGQQTTFLVDEFDNIHILGGAPGSVCCTDDSGERILEALTSGENQVQVWPTEDPDAKGVNWAESLGIKEVVGEFTTNFVPNQARVLNIARIAELTQGVVIEPGETFSVNSFVGPRTIEKGFVAAGMILNGVFVDSVGGGISQYATTLFNAAFFAGLDFGDYQSHSIYLSRYPYGREATVSYPAPDLEIINNTPFGVLLWPTVDDNSITVRLFSTKSVSSEQTGQRKVRVGQACTNVYTDRTRTFLEDDREEVDTVFARYRPEGLRCDGTPTVTTTTTSTTIPTDTTTVPPDTTTTTIPTTTTSTPTTTVPDTTTTTTPTTTTTAPNQDDDSGNPTDEPTGPTDEPVEPADEPVEPTNDVEDADDNEQGETS